MDEAGNAKIVQTKKPLKIKGLTRASVLGAGYRISFLMRSIILQYIYNAGIQ